MSRLALGQSVRGVVWQLLAQAAIFFIQIVYAALVSRHLDPEAFGLYAVALATTVLFNLVAAGGLGQAVMRAGALDEATVRSIVTLSGCIGLPLALLFALGAPIWSSLASADASLGIMRVMAATIFLSPVVAVLLAELRRRGRHRALALVQIASATIGAIAGASLVLLYERIEFLAVNLLASQACIIVVTTFLVGVTALPGRLRVSSLPHVRFGGVVAVSNILSYIQQNALRLLAPRLLGTTALGLWNRGDVLSTSPFQALQVALIQTTYPRFRAVPVDPKARSQFMAALPLVVVIAGAPAVLLSVFASVLVPIVLGPGLTGVQSILPFLAALAASQLIASFTAAFLEALSEFKQIFTNQVLGLVLLAVAIAAVAMGGLLTYGLLVLTVSNVVRHSWQLHHCARNNWVDTRTLLIGYAEALILLSILTACLLAARDSSTLILAMSIAFAVAVLLVRNRHRVQLWKDAQLLYGSRQ